MEKFFVKNAFSFFKTWKNKKYFSASHKKLFAFFVEVSQKSAKLAKKQKDCLFKSMVNTIYSWREKSKKEP